MTQISDYGVCDQKLRPDFTMLLSTGVYYIHVQGTLRWGHTLLLPKEGCYGHAGQCNVGKNLHFSALKKTFYVLSVNLYLCSIAV